MIKGLGDKIASSLEAATQGIGDDPLLWFIRTLRKVGVILVVTGIALGVAGFYLKAASVTAVQALRTIYNQIASNWSNIKAPSIQPAATGTAPILGPNVLQDLQNFGQDAWTDVNALGSDVAQIGGALGTLGEDIALGVVDLAKSLFTIGTNLPGIAWNGLVAVVGGGIADILNWAFPYLIVFGLIALGASVVLSIVHQVVVFVKDEVVAPAWSEAKATWRERQKATWRPVFDRILGNHRSVPGAQLQDKAAIAHRELPAAATASDNQGAAVAGPEPERKPAPPAIESPAEPAPAPVVIVEPAPTPATTEEVEQLLGESMQQQRDQLRAELRRGYAAPPRAPRVVIEEPVEEVAEPDLTYEILAEPLEA